VAGFSGQYEASDGYFMIMGGGLASPEAWTALVTLIGGADPAMGEELADPKWSDQAFMASPQAKKDFARIVSTAAKHRTRQELYDAAKSLRVPMGPVLSPKDLLSNAQLAYRNYFVPVWSQAAGRELTMPRAPYLLSESPAGPVSPAPALGDKAVWEAAQ
jgi:crotonobetainyl-CoA:carnitine CoA-transferase CaiB-like acyl-CoA transferase